uniref:NADH dehydrogenase subunit 4L n=1 Tax=Mooreobdella quaternaria TaxID=3027019 RepID=UPI0023D88344|nr:NADH dehydrogenase subunit 4L [Mooreobdella quaternaria]WDA96106.1 NADH dehydrogenase subunit 4L [Mooreobdella quaternaria]
MKYQHMVILMIPLITMINLLLHNKYLLITLLSLEAITLATLIFIMNTYMLANMNYPIVSILILTVGACEASLGLTLLVIMSRSYGNDLIKNLNASKC